MRGHDDGCVKPVSFAVEAQKAVLDGFTGIYVRQGTGTHAGIEPGFDLFIETSVVCFPLGVCPRFRGGACATAYALPGRSPGMASARRKVIQ